ncbi:FxsA family protein [Nonomuraea spiralis]|uniref:FxsA family protein n=1 Tax=Nonomuraea TaxID=83681 RepID=UPI000F7A7698|nr:FxsA family protein [Nonomuraea sp. WAC 01424]RSN06534.1 FxsA protein [Nonomuraea sp. WAC 01424]
MRLLLLLAFLAVPVLEVWLLIQVGSLIGGWPTAGLLVAGSLLGAWLVRREGRRVWRSLQAALSEGRVPDRALADGGLAMAGGVLLMVPGFFTDVVGLFFVLPFTRPLMRRLASGFFDRRVRRMAAASPYADVFPPTPGGGQAAYDDRGVHGGKVVQGKVVHGEVIRDERDD